MIWVQLAGIVISLHVFLEVDSEACHLGFLPIDEMTRSWNAVKSKGLDSNTIITYD